MLPGATLDAPTRVRRVIPGRARRRLRNPDVGKRPGCREAPGSSCPNSPRFGCRALCDETGVFSRPLCRFWPVVLAGCADCREAPEPAGQGVLGGVGESLVPTPACTLPRAARWRGTSGDSARDGHRQNTSSRRIPGSSHGLADFETVRSGQRGERRATPLVEAVETHPNTRSGRFRQAPPAGRRAGLRCEGQRASRAAWMRSETSSTSPRASTETSTPRSA